MKAVTTSLLGRLLIISSLVAAKQSSGVCAVDNPQTTSTSSENDTVDGTQTTEDTDTHMPDQRVKCLHFQVGVDVSSCHPKPNDSNHLVFPLLILFSYRVLIYSSLACMISRKLSQFRNFVVRI